MVKIRFLKSYKPYLVFGVVFVLNLLIVHLLGGLFGLIFRPFFPGDVFRFRYLFFTIFNVSFLLAWLIISKLEGFPFVFLFDEYRMKRILKQPLVYIIGVLNLYLYFKYFGKYIYSPYAKLIGSLSVRYLVIDRDFYKLLYLIEAISFMLCMFIVLFEGMNILTYTKGGNILIYFIVSLAVIMIILIIIKGAMILCKLYKLYMEG